jgi:hypothetical protein
LRGRLPTWVVRMRSGLEAIAVSSFRALAARLA